MKRESEEMYKSNRIRVRKIKKGEEEKVKSPKEQ